MSEVKKVTKRPFHETIVDAVTEAHPIDLSILAWLTMATKIPKGHDEIIAAWEKREPNAPKGSTIANVLADLREQKQEAEAEAQRIAEDPREDLCVGRLHPGKIAISPD
jgi:hypothetical protein